VKKYICNYSNKFRRTSLIYNLLLNRRKKIIQSRKSISIVGRVFYKRIMGKASFLKIRDISGNIQIYLSEKDLFNYDSIISYLNLGDIIGIKGKLFFTRTKEITLRVNYILFLSKNLKSFPDKWKGVLEKEVCYRQRYLDLMVNSKTKYIFILRSKILFLIRLFFLKKKYFEVETPIMQKVAGGALAKPFVTHHNFLNSDLYLRISPELYLKRLVVGGFEKVFEIGKVFRNEGLSNVHHPEFTMIEFYQAYSNYSDLMKLTEHLFMFLCKSLFSSFVINYNDSVLNFFKPFKKISFIDSILYYNKDLNYNTLCKDIEGLRIYLNKKKLEFNSNYKLVKLQLYFI